MSSSDRTSGPRLTVLHGRRIPHRGSGHTHGPRAVELRVPARVEALAVVRAITCCLADYEDLGSDTADDLALAVDEACTVLIGIAPPGAYLELVQDPRAHELNVRVSTDCDGVESVPGSAVLSGFSRRVLEALTERVDTFVDDTDYERTGNPKPTLGISLTVRRRAAAPG
jgi:serine/threonine-protein kinase RsbW